MLQAKCNYINSLVMFFDSRAIAVFMLQWPIICNHTIVRKHFGVYKQIGWRKGQGINLDTGIPNQT